MAQTTNSIQIDTRAMAPQLRRSMAFEAFDQLDVDMSMELVNDHNILQLRSQFELEKPNLFTWNDLESGPEVWRAAITKLKGKHGVDHCCGACGGQG